MSIESTAQSGAQDPFPRPIVELQQIVLGMFLIWDALDEDYDHQKNVEVTVLKDWADKYKIPWPTALEALVRIKLHLTDCPFSYFLACRNYSVEGWISFFSFNPEGNDDVLSEIQRVLKKRPFSPSSSS